MVTTDIFLADLDFYVSIDRVYDLFHQYGIQPMRVHYRVCVEVDRVNSNKINNNPISFVGAHSKRSFFVLDNLDYTRKPQIRMLQQRISALEMRICKLDMQISQLTQSLHAAKQSMNQAKIIDGQEIRRLNCKFNEMIWKGNGEVYLSAPPSPSKCASIVNVEW
tara:strand:+ start:1069 stop:1560 length:492 start_codon:yes stop_codon:yes gene_type:complete